MSSKMNHSLHCKAYEKTAVQPLVTAVEMQYVVYTVYEYHIYMVYGKVGHSMIIYLRNYRGVIREKDDISVHIISFTVEICHAVAVQPPSAAQRTTKLWFQREHDQLIGSIIP